MKKKRFFNLSQRVIKKGLCTGCGTCVGVCPAKAIEFDLDLEEPVLKGSCKPCGLCYATCPGADIPLLRLEKKFFGESRTQKNEILGVSKSFVKGFAGDPEIRQLGASGGITTALLVHALDVGMIDGAIVTAMDARRPWRVRPVIARTKAELMDAAKSKYAISPNNRVLREVETGDRLAVVGLPCHVHGLRKLQAQKRLSNLCEKIVFILGLFCGSNVSYHATEHMIQEYSDINLGEIERFEYRGGTDSQDVKIFTRDKREITLTTAQRQRIFHSMTKDRCRMCCDWAAELSDLSLCDIFDPQGVSRKVSHWNGVIVRTERGLRLIEEAEKAGAIRISPLEEESFYGNSTFEGKRHGAVYTLRERKRYGWPVPDYHYEFTWQPRRRNLYPVPKD